ncbi:hypothetical protein BC829DRAFT_387025 [Chytridium lagenaria]|nr:hypothetical protein BC829DRAFT_387025 [Chytridium lagenaria]
MDFPTTTHNNQTPADMLLQIDGSGESRIFLVHRYVVDGNRVLREASRSCDLSDVHREFQEWSCMRLEPPALDDLSSAWSFSTRTIPLGQYLPMHCFLTTKSLFAGKWDSISLSPTFSAKHNVSAELLELILSPEHFKTFSADVQQIRQLLRNQLFGSRLDNHDALELMKLFPAAFDDTFPASVALTLMHQQISILENNLGDGNAGWPVKASFTQTLLQKWPIVASVTFLHVIIITSVLVAAWVFWWMKNKPSTSSKLSYSTGATSRKHSPKNF